MNAEILYSMLRAERFPLHVEKMLWTIHLIRLTLIKEKTQSQDHDHTQKHMGKEGDGTNGLGEYNEQTHRQTHCFTHKD